MKRTKPAEYKGTAMENTQEILSEVMKLVYREYTGITEIERLTRELEETLDRGDREAAQLILEMRQKEMEQVSEAERSIGVFLESMEPGLREDARQLLKGTVPAERTEPEAVKISGISRQIQNVLERTRAIDRVMSRKVAGEDSYYKE